ncbi:MAG: hypothetical protein ACRD6X_19205, partial [Pyrinomonadaceae bacterium]
PYNTKIITRCFKSLDVFDAQLQTNRDGDISQSPQLLEKSSPFTAFLMRGAANMLVNLYWAKFVQTANERLDYHNN